MKTENNFKNNTRIFSASNQNKKKNIQPGAGKTKFLQKKERIYYIYKMNEDGKCSK